MSEIITGDCREVMARMEPESVGMILTSPPYNVGLKYEGFEDRIPDEDFRQFNYEWLAQSYRVAMDTARLYVVMGDKMIWWFREQAEKAGWTYCQLMTWCKPNFASHPNGISMDWNLMSEQIMLFRKGKRTPMLNSNHETTTHNWFVEAVPQSNFKDGRIHPAQMPLKLCKRIISRTPGDPVLDPFAGSGQVCRAAKALGRGYIGIELVPVVAERARQFVEADRRRVIGQSVPMFAPAE